MYAENQRYKNKPSILFIQISSQIHNYRQFTGCNKNKNSSIETGLLALHLCASFQFVCI